MKTSISLTPTKDAGNYITQKLLDHATENILFLVSGGSALAVLPYINLAIPDIQGNLTIATTDERFSTDKNVNNFLQLQSTDFYKIAEGSQVTFINSLPYEYEDLQTFTKRLQVCFEDYYVQHPNTYTIAILGIGEDGHTASIFPATEQKFNEQYMTNQLYVSVVNESLEHPNRTTITPSFIEEKIDEVILFAVGSTKCDNILNYMHNKNFSQHQIPALIPAQHPQSILFTDCQSLV